MATASPRPWHYTLSQPGVYYIDEEAFHSRGHVAVIYAAGKDAVAEANARLICLAANNLDPLRETLAELLPFAKDAPLDLLKRAERALADAERGMS